MNHYVLWCIETSAADNWSEEDHEKSSVLLDTSDTNERLSVCLQLADARQPPDYRAKIVGTITDHVELGLLVVMCVVD